MVYSKIKSPIRIIIDDRELKSRVPEFLKLYSNIHAETERLPYGDYLAGGHLLIERKTVPDFSMSITSGRLFQQAANMNQFPFWRLLILEGKRYQNTGISRNAMMGAILALTLRFGIPVLRSLNEEETAGLIVSAIKYLEIPYKSFRIYNRTGIQVSRNKIYDPVEMLQHVPNVGRRRARILMNHFGSIQGLANTDKEELIHLPGIGKGTAEAIDRMVRGSKGEKV